MDPSRPAVRRNTQITVKKSSQILTTSKGTSRAGLITSSDLQHTKLSKVCKTGNPVNPCKSSKLIGLKSPISPSDITSKDFTRGPRIPKLTVPARGSFISPSGSEEKLLQSKFSHQYSMSTSILPDPTIKKNKDLTLDIKKTLKEMKEEAQQCASSSRKSLNSGKKIHEYENSEGELRDSFTTKTPFSSDLNEDLKSTSLLKKDDMLDIKNKIDLLFDKIHQTEIDSKEHELENLKLKETIKGLETKLEDIKFFNQPRTPSCAGNCEVF